jgi:branched-chain amino acid aminotransferase
MLQGYDERNADIVYWVDGVLRHRDEPGISPFDSAVQGGDAVWEGLRLYQGSIFGLTAHLARLRRSAAALGFAAVPADAEITAAIAATLRANRMFDGVHIRLTLTRGVKITSGMDPRLNRAGPTLIVLAEYKAPVYDTTGLRLITASVRRPGPDVLDPKIHHANLLNSILAKIEATVAGADDALMLDGRGFVAETNATHLFAAIGGALVTPATAACPEGITRQTVLDLARSAGIPAAVRDVSLAEMYAADEAFCTGTMGEIAGVTMIDGRTIGTGRPGDLTGRIARLYQQHARAHGTPIVGR